ncbi:hypothetical protein ABIF63_004836 [Bradyrhizobium japonicum]|uniref:Novel STAND NTPase 1 domain-containing protein n=1 Tax=Bradyrhizobium japonicum TaxID=375 RepID=A0ABV2RWQ3_BRAJP
MPFEYCVRVIRSGTCFGTGMLVDARHVLTCAHVVDAALGRKKDALEFPRGGVEVEFPWAKPNGLESAKVVGWHAAAKFGSASGSLSDIAVLRLARDRPDPMTAATLAIEELPSGGRLSAAGFPGAGPAEIAIGMVSGQLGGERIQIHGQEGAEIRPGFSGAPAVTERGCVVGMVFAREQDKGLAWLLPAERLDTAWKLALNPYKGLAGFEPEDAAYFFGRTEEIRELTKRIGPTATIVVGPTGSGKSSLVLAGILPTINKKGQPPDWLVARFRPGSRPVEKLAEALAELAGSRSDTQKIQAYASRLRGDATEIVRIADELQGNSDARLLLLADQMEEAFTLCTDGEMRKNLFEIVRAVKKDAGNNRVCFLGTLRAESVGHALEDRVLAETLIPRDFFLLQAISGHKQLMEVISTPAERLGVTLDQELASKLLHAAAQETNPVPLLAFALHRIWQKLERRKITADAIEALGGTLKNAMPLYANSIIDRMDTAEQETARRLLCSLVSFEGLAAEAWAKRSICRDDLAPELWAMAERLSGMGAERDARLVVIGADATGRQIVDLAHDGLIRAWQRLSDWINEARGLAASRSAVEKRRSEWKAKPDDERLLPSGYELEDGKRLLALKPGDPVQIREEVREFIQRSIDIRTKEARLRELKDREIALTRREAISSASRQLLRVEDAARKLCEAVLDKLGFDYAAVQLVDKGERTIGTIHGQGQQGDWFGIASHPLDIEGDDPSLFDIQAHVAAKPPRIEVIAGYDNRFDQFIFRKFGHQEHVRAFVPIVLAGDSEKPLGWNWREIAKREQRPDYRRAWEAEGAGRLGEYEIIGTVEAGFTSRKCEIACGQVVKLAELAHLHAPSLWDSSLEHVFQAVVDAAATVLKPAGAYLGFAFNTKRKRFEYERRFGDQCALGSSGFAATASRKPGTEDRRLQQSELTLLPSDREGADADAYNRMFPDARAAGLHAEALVPIKVSDPDREAPPIARGILHLVFTEEITFSKYDEEYLRSLATRGRGGDQPRDRDRKGPHVRPRAKEPSSRCERIGAVRGSAKDPR